MENERPWPYPRFGDDDWLRGDGADPALLAVRDAVTAVLQARGQRPGSDPSLLAGLAALADLDERIDWALLALVAQARAEGMSWAALGDALGVSKQAVHKRLRPWVEQALRTSPSGLPTQDLSGETSREGRSAEGQG